MKLNCVQHVLGTIWFWTLTGLPLYVLLLVNYSYLVSEMVNSDHLGACSTISVFVCSRFYYVFEFQMAKSSSVITKMGLFYKSSIELKLNPNNTSTAIPMGHINCQSNILTNCRDLQCKNVRNFTVWAAKLLVTFCKSVFFAFPFRYVWD